MLTSVRRPQNPQIGPVRTQASTHLCNTYTCVFKLSNVVKCVRKLCVSKYPVNWPPQPSAEAEAVHRANSADFVSFKQTKSSLGRHSLSENRTLYHAPFPRSSKLNTSWVEKSYYVERKALQISHPELQNLHGHWSVVTQRVAPEKLI